MSLIHRFRRKRLAGATALLCTAMAGGGALAADVSPEDWAQLSRDAQLRGHVPVLIGLQKFALDALGNNIAGVRAAMAQKGAALRAELGANAWDAGAWNNGIGQMGLHVNAAGLAQLRQTNLAVDFMADTGFSGRRRPRDDDGSLDAIEQQLDRAGRAQVEIELNVAIPHTLAADGSTQYTPNNASDADIAERLNALLAHPQAARLQALDAGQAAAAAARRPQVRATVDRETYLWLVTSEHVRAMRLQGHRDNRPVLWDSDLLDHAKKHGEVGVIFTLRGSAAYSPKVSYMSKTAWENQSQANRRAFEELLSNAQVAFDDNTMTLRADLGILSARLSAAAIQRLVTQRDPRIISAIRNRPVASTLLANSANLVNMPVAWNAGYRAAGQNIVVIDSGVRKDHAFFTTNGVSRVTYEACFGTTANGFQSICPSANAKGDSPPGLSGSGAPWSNLAACATLAQQTPPNRHNCGHGTNVAGIAAGRKSSQFMSSTVQGMAPDASIIAVQVFSYDATSTPLRAGAFDEDIHDALTAVWQGYPLAGSPAVVNMSLGGRLAAGDCDTSKYSINAIVDKLRASDVPVVAATGNDSNKSQINWPACVPYVIKVSAVPNNATGDTVSNFANIGVPTNYTGPIFLAPGGSTEPPVNFVYSADRLTSTSVIGMAGTSQAAPHVAGLYAAIKAAAPGITLDGATAWINNSGSVPVTIQLPGTTGLTTFRRIRVPNSF